MIISQKRSSVTKSFTFPQDGGRVYEKTPTFIFQPDDGARTHTYFIFDDRGKILERGETDIHYFKPRSPLTPGEYSWKIESDIGNESEIIRFTVDEEALDGIMPTSDEILSGMPRVHPRHIFEKADIPQLLEKKSRELEVIRRNAEIAYAHGFPKPPRHHREREGFSRPMRVYFGDYRSYCDRDLIATSLLYALTGDGRAKEHAKELLFTVCDMNPKGPCAVNGEWGDEVGLSNARCLPAAFDLLYDALDAKERRYVGATLAEYAEQCYKRLLATNYISNPSNSHVGRIPAYLGEAALVLYGEGIVPDETLKAWLDFALEIYTGIFPYYGGDDGSWAEGTFYSTSYTKWFLPFFSACERYSGKSLFDRPFYHRYTDYLIHFADPRREIHPFGDGYWCTPDSEEWPGFFAQNPYRVYAEKFGPELARERMEELSFAEKYELHLLDIFLPISPYKGKSLAREPKNLAVFPDGGFAAIHSDIYSDDDIAVLCRASRFSHDSHRHADQGSFALFAGRHALISPSGYFGAGYGTRHHFEWLKKTKAHNTLIIGGYDQTAVPNTESTGCITEWSEDDKSITLDLSSAYPNVREFRRTLSLSGTTLTVTDTVVSDEDVDVLYPLHALSEPRACGNSVEIERGDTKLTVTPISGELMLDTVTDKFDVDVNEGVADEYKVTMPKQYHVYYKAAPARRHEIRVEYIIEYKD